MLFMRHCTCGVLLSLVQAEALGCSCLVAQLVGLAVMEPELVDLAGIGVAVDSWQFDNCVMASRIGH